MSKVKTAKAAIILIGLLFFTVNTSLVFAEVSNINSAGNFDSKRDSTSAARQKIINKEGKLEGRIENFKEKIASKTAALKLKLQAFKDQRKAVIAERVNTNLNLINQNQTTRMQKHLDNMSSILNKLEARVNQLTPDVKDPANAKIAIASARNMIASASAAVSLQAQNDYTIQVSTESRIRIDAKAMRDKLHVDLLAARKGVINAKQSVANAIRTTKSGPMPKNEDIEKEGTTSGRK